MSLDFNKIKPWSEMIRCNMADDENSPSAYFGDSWYNEDGYKDDGITQVQTYVEMPMFWYRRYKDIPSSELANAISFRPKAGFDLHETFKRPDGIKTKIYVGAFLASFYDVSREEYSDYYKGNATPNTDGNGDPDRTTPVVAVVSGDTINDVADKIRAAESAFPAYTLGGTDAEVTFLCKTNGAKTTPAWGSAKQGVDGSWSVVSAGDDDNPASFTLTVTNGATSTGNVNISIDQYTGFAPNTAATTGDKLSSIAGRFPLTKLTRAQFRQMARNRGEKFSEIDIATWSAMQLLQMIELGSLDGQTALGMGVTNKTGYTYYKAEKTGTTAYTLEDPNYGEATGLYHMMYRGIEDFWGNCWQFIDGININFTTVSATADTPIPYWCNDITLYADDTTTNYEDMGIVLSSYPSIGGNGYIKNIHENPKWAFMPSEHQASAGYFRDYWYPSNTTGWRVLLGGGFWAYGGLSGPWTLRASISSATTLLHFSGRLQKV